MKLDANAMFASLFDSFGVPYKETWIVPQTDEDKQIRAAEKQQPNPQDPLVKIQAQTAGKKEIDDNQAENRMLVETGKHSLKEQGKGTDQANALELQKQAAAQKAAQQTPEAQGFDRAAKGAFANEDKAVFGS